MNTDTISRYRRATMQFLGGTSYSLMFDVIHKHNDGIEFFDIHDDTIFRCLPLFDSFAVYIGGGFGREISMLYVGDEKTANAITAILDEKLNRLLGNEY